ncbi:MAG TPA: cyanophycinase [Gemmatimonadaceae bacterium]|nr:cyanophycinase [Gemmatimonadaceae bacterium]
MQNPRGARRSTSASGALIRDAPQPNGRTPRRRLRDAKGALILIGGGTTATGSALAAFIEMTGAKDGASIVGLTTASSQVKVAREMWLSDLTQAGATNVTIPVVETREQASDAANIEHVRRARGIFLGGGDQVKLVSCLSGTPLEEAIRDAYLDGAIICGTSAGAAALTKTTLAGNEVDEEGKLVEQYIGPGLGLLGYHTLIDTHFTQRRRLYRLFVAIAQFPALMGLGIDEDTALVVKREIGTVVGKGGVTFVDGSSVRFNNASDVTKGHELTISALRVGIVGTGQQFNLKKREVVALLSPPAAREIESRVTSAR